MLSVKIAILVAAKLFRERDRVSYIDGVADVDRMRDLYCMADTDGTADRYRARNRDGTTDCDRAADGYCPADRYECEKFTGTVEVYGMRDVNDVPYLNRTRDVDWMRNGYGITNTDWISDRNGSCNSDRTCDTHSASDVYSVSDTDRVTGRCAIAGRRRAPDGGRISESNWLYRVRHESRRIVYRGIGKRRCTEAGDKRERDKSFVHIGLRINAASQCQRIQPRR